VINGSTVLAVIPARAGSKRCPGKNKRNFRGKPLLHWTTDAAQDSKHIDTIIVSTDDEEIRALACVAVRLDRWIGVHWRTPELATDSATNEDVCRAVLAKAPHDLVVLLQPTSPLRISEDIDICIRACMVHKAAIVTVSDDGPKNGAVYVASAGWIANNDFSAPTLTYGMPNERSLDIDYPEQFE